MFICAIAASLHLRCIPLLSGMDRVADNPKLRDWFALISVLIGLCHVGVISLPSATKSGTPSGPSTSTSICISSPSGNHLVPSALVLSSYHDSQG